MRLNEAQCRELLFVHGTYLTEMCDNCGWWPHGWLGRAPT
jgi:hypothetical protein